MKRSYFVLAAAFSIMFIIGGNTKSLGVFLPSLIDQLNADTWIIGSAISVLNISGCLLAPFAGFLGRRFTSRYVAMFCGCVVCLSFISCSLATRPAHLLLPFILAGNGMRVIKVLAMAMVAEHFHASFGQAIGAASCGLASGVIVMAPISQFFLDTYGLKDAFVLLGAVNAHFVICGAVLIPCDGRISPRHYEPISERNKTTKPWLRTIMVLLNSSLFTNPQFLYLLIFQALDSIAYVGWIIYLVSLAESKGISSYLSAIIASIGGVGSMAGKIITPLFIDRHILPQTVVYYIGFIAMCVALVGHAVLSSFEGLLVSSLLFGISSGALTVVIYKHCKTSIDSDKLTEAFAWLEISLIVGSALASIFTGRMFDLTGSYVTSFLVLGLVPMLGVLTLIADSVYHKCCKKSTG